MEALDGAWKSLGIAGLGSSAGLLRFLRDYDFYVLYDSSQMIMIPPHGPRKVFVADDMDDPGE